jgi:hypothetical protein
MLKLSSAMNLVPKNCYAHSLTKEENDHDHEDCVLLLFLGILPRRWRFTSVDHCLDWIDKRRLGVMAVIVRGEATT